MKGRVKTTFLMLSTACFVAMASGGVLYLHLHHHEGPHHHEDPNPHEDPAPHDSEHCSICQQLFFSKKAFTVAPEPTGFDLERVERIPTVPQTTPILQVSLDRTRPRAPPA